MSRLDPDPRRASRANASASLGPRKTSPSPASSLPDAAGCLTRAAQDIALAPLFAWADHMPPLS